MKNTIILTIIIQLIGYTLFAQKYELTINSGTNLTFIPDFTNHILIANDGMLIPGLISLPNSVNVPLISKSRSETTAQLGFFADLEFRKNIGDECKLSFSAGFSQMKFDYDTYVDVEGTPHVKLSNLTQNYGNTNLFYVNLRPLNFSIGLFQNKFTLQGGASFNFLVKSNYYNTVILYTTKQVGGETVDIIDKVYFESIGDMNKILYGVHLRAESKIIKRLYLFISGQYYFNSIYDDKTSYSQTLKECNPFQVQAGVSFIFWQFGKKKTRKKNR